MTSDERRRQIALTAASLFAKRGFNGVTTREIANACNVNEALIFRHFPHKEDLYTEIINQKISIQPCSFDQEAARLGDDKRVFGSVARFMLAQVEQDNTFLRLLLYSALEGHDLSNLFLSSRTSVLVDYLFSYVEKRISEGGFKDIRPAVVIRAFIGMFFHFIMARELFRFPPQLEVSKDEAVENFVDIFLKGTIK